MEQDTILGEIIKNETDKIIISMKEYKGRKYIDIRTYFQGEDGSYIPTKKGITLSPKFINVLINLFVRAKQLKMEGGE